MKKILMALMAVALVVILTVVTVGSAVARGGPTYDKPAKGIHGKSNVATSWLVEKDSSWNIVSRDQGGAFGKVKYNLRGTSLELDIAAHKLAPNDEFQIEIEVDGGTIYAIAAGVPSDAGGDLRVSLTLDEFAEAPEAMVPEYWNDDPTSLVPGHTYSIKVWVKDDDLPAWPAWDDDGNATNYIYRLWEFLPLEFTAQ